VHVRLLHDSAADTLVVTVLEARYAAAVLVGPGSLAQLTPKACFRHKAWHRGLLAGDSNGLSDPYVVLRLLPEPKRDGKVSGERRNLVPVFCSNVGRLFAS